jgi:hypothetical protein
MWSLLAHVGVAALTAMPSFSESNRQPPENLTTARCPMCDQTALTIVAELSFSVFFRCGSCGFIWMEDTADAPDSAKDRTGD